MHALYNPRIGKAIDHSGAGEWFFRLNEDESGTFRHQDDLSLVLGGRHMTADLSLRTVSFHGTAKLVHGTAVTVAGSRAAGKSRLHREQP